MSHLPAIFMRLTPVCLAFALVSLITPSAAFFLKNNSRLRAFCAYLGMALLFLAGAWATAPKQEQPTAPQNGSAPAPAEQKAASEPAPEPAAASPAAEQSAQEQKAQEAKDTREPAPAAVPPAVPPTAEATEKAPAEEARLIPYRLIKVSDASFAGRRRMNFRVLLTEPGAPLNAGSLAKTCMAAAKHFAESRKIQAVQVTIDDILAENSHFLAVCSYAPDKGGWNGKDGWTWGKVRAARRGRDRAELEMKEMWYAMSWQYQKNGVTNEAALKAAIAKKLGIKAEDISPASPELLPKDVDNAERFANVQPQGPVQQPQRKK